jgi:polyisoprenoid-binding protein YceI
MSKQINVKKMKKVVILGLFAMPLFFASCGGGEADADTTDADSTVVNEEVEVIEATYGVDTTASVINWNNFEGTEVDHSGTVNVLNGSMDITTTNGVGVITAANLTVDMNSIQEGSEKLEGHLKNEDFFDVNQFATTTFAFDRHENDMIYGTATIVGKEVAVEAPATVTVDGDNATVEVGEFKIDFAALEMPFFIADVEMPVEEQHDPMIGFSATIVGTK